MKLPVLIAALVTCSVAYSVNTSRNNVQQMIDRINNMRKDPEIDALLTKHEEAFAEIYRQDQEDQDETMEQFNFQCGSMTPSPQKPTSVHQLRPADVNVIGSMGDSLTAGNGATAFTVIGVYNEDRGRAFSIGGDRTFPTQTTLPKFLESYSGLYGSSVGTSNRNHPNSGLNVAEPGNIASDMPGQARMLVDRMRSDSRVNFNNDWKVVTVFVGGNDLCYYCTDTNYYSRANYRRHIQDALDILHREMPRTLVNLLPIFDMQSVSDLDNGFSCSLVHDAICPCKPKNNAQKQEISQWSLNYQQEVESLVNSGRYDTKQDFTVVVQPMFKKSTPPRKSNGDYDYSYWAPDCFHFSAKGHNTAGANLWNNMVEPVGGKAEQWNPNLSNYKCTSANRPYFATRQNSRNGNWT